MEKEGEQETEKRKRKKRKYIIRRSCNFGNNNKVTNRISKTNNNSKKTKLNSLTNKIIIICYWKLRRIVRRWFLDELVFFMDIIEYQVHTDRYNYRPWN